MRIIKKGRPTKTVYRGECEKCYSIVEAQEREVVKNDGHYTALCPVCKKYGLNTEIVFSPEEVDVKSRGQKSGKAKKAA